MSTPVIDKESRWLGLEATDRGVDLYLGSHSDNEQWIDLSPEDCITLSRALVKAAAEALGVQA